MEFWMVAILRLIGRTRHYELIELKSMLITGNRMSGGGALERGDNAASDLRNYFQCRYLGVCVDDFHMRGVC